MYKKILVPTDGSDVSNRAAIKGVKFAKHIGAEVVAIYVAPEYQYPVYVEIIPPTYPSEEEYQDTMTKTGEIHLQPILDAAQSEGVQCQAVTEFSDVPAEKIADVVREHECDLVFMGSHGRTGFGRIFLGSVASRVLTLSPVPVLVDRLEKEAGENKKAKNEAAGF